MKLTKKFIAGLLSASLSVTLLTGISYNVENNDIKAQAESVAKTGDATVLETDVKTAAADCTMLGVYGSYYSQAKEALDRINEIRKEACEAGNVPNPASPSSILTSNDYVPIKWSKDLESIARIRAVEGGLAYSFLASGHSRLNGKDIWSVQYNSVQSNAENLAYNWGTSMVSGINQWYEEKSDWVNRKSGAVTGHYTSMINPEHTYVGLGDFYTKEAHFPNTLAGAFCSASQNLDQSMQTAQENIMQKIEVKNSYIKGYILEGNNTIDIGNTTELTLKANLANSSNTLKLWVLNPVTYTSSDTSVAQVTDIGVVTGQKAGTATITANSGTNKLADILITIKSTAASTATPTTTPTAAPTTTPTARPTARPTATPTTRPTATPTARPTTTPTARPTTTPTAAPTARPTNTPRPTRTPRPTTTPRPTDTSRPTATPKSTAAPKSTSRPNKLSPIQRNKELLKKIKVNKKISIKRGNSKKLELRIPKDATIVKKFTGKDGEIKVSYYSDNKSIAKVNKKGKITAKKKGTVNITTTVTFENRMAKNFTTKVKVKKS